jgi:tetratricopeptide (TPR) repeat protein
MPRVLRIFLILVVFLAGESLAVMGYIEDDPEELRRAAFSRLETLYEAKKWDETIGFARQLMAKLPQDHPLRMKAYDLMVLGVRHQSEDKLAAERAAKKAANRAEGRKMADTAGTLLKDKKYPEAATQLAQAIQRGGGDAETWYLLGFAREEAGDKESALTAFEKALELDEGHLQALLHAAQLQFSQGRADLAEDRARRLIQALDKRIEELQELALQQKAIRMNDKAMETARQIVALRQHLIKATFVFGILTEQRGAHTEARAALQRCIRLQPGNPEAYYHLGRAFLQSKIFHQSTLAFEQAMFIWEARLKEVKQAAKKLLDEGKADAAVAAELRAKDITQKLVMTMYSHAVANWRRNDTQSAIESIDKALALKPDFVQGRFARAVYLATTNDFSEAMKEMQEVLRNAPPQEPTGQAGHRSGQVSAGSDVPKGTEGHPDGACDKERPAPDHRGQ